MRIFTRFLSIAASTAIAASTVIAATTASSVAAPAPAAGDLTDLPAFGDLAVDDTYRHLFVSGGPTSNGVVVTDFSGRRIKTIGGQYGATGLALSADGKQLYVALAAGDAISVIDTKKLVETARYGTGAGTCPTHLTRTDTLVWFGYGCDGTWSGGIGRLDPAATAPVVRDQQVSDVVFQRAPLLAGATDADGPVVAAQLRLSLSTVHVYAVSAGTLTPQTSGDSPGSNLNDVAVSPAGDVLYTAAGSRDHVPAYATADLAGRGSYPTGYYPDAVAPAPDGRYLAGGVRNTRDDVYVYKVDGVSPHRRIDLGTDPLTDRGLAWTADCDRLFAVTQPPAGGSPSLHVVSNPT